MGRVGSIGRTGETEGEGVVVERLVETTTDPASPTVIECVLGPSVGTKFQSTKHWN